MYTAGTGRLKLVKSGKSKITVCALDALGCARRPAVRLPGEDAVQHPRDRPGHTRHSHGVRNIFILN